MGKAQGALEYLLLIGGGVLVASIVTVLVLGVQGSSGSATQFTANNLAIRQSLAQYNGAYYQLSGDPTDTSGRNAALSNNGGVTFAQGKYGQAANFTTTGQFFSGNPVDIHNNITLAAWINPTSYPTERATIILGTGAYYLSLASDASIQTYWYDSTGTGYGYYSSAPVGASCSAPLNTWTHAAAVWDGSTVQIYVNGSLCNTITGVTVTGRAVSGLIIGAEGSRQFLGKMQQVLILNRAMSPSEIASLAK